MATKGTLKFFSGNDVLIKFTVQDENNPPAVKNLTGATDVTFAIARSQGKTPDLSVSLISGIIITDPVNGKLEVTLTKAQTEPLGEKQEWWELRITDSSGSTATAAYGPAVILPNSITT